MSKFSEYLKQNKIKEMHFFFGEDAEVYTDYVKHFTHYINDDEIRLITNDIKIIKDQYVLIISNNKAVYLKPWQVMKVKNWNLEMNSYVVKLNRKYFKPCTFKFIFDNYETKATEDSFDDLIKIAKEQDNNQIPWKYGHYNF